VASAVLPYTARQDTEQNVSDDRPVRTPWAPLGLQVFRAFWIAGLVSNIGTWMQTVGAQWVLIEVPDSTTLVALVQTASTLPILLLAMPAGVLADILDRRRLLIAVQLFQAAAAAGLAILTGAGQMTPPLLLLFTFALGAGQALAAPANLALLPELVPRHLLVEASALGSAETNIARSIGPALAGAIIARVGPAAVFALNAVSFLAVAVVLALWRRDASEDEMVPERFSAALRAGGRYVRHSPVVRRLLLRQASFVVPAVSLWALLPVVAHGRLGMGPGGYGILLGALGLGAVGGVGALPFLRSRLGANHRLQAATATYAVALAGLALARQPVVAFVALLPAGAAWVCVLTDLGASVQLVLPAWVRARGLSASQIVTAGATAGAALGWGLLASRVGVVRALLAAAVLLAVAALVTIPVLPLRDISRLDPSSAEVWPDPALVLEPPTMAGPVLVMSTYTVLPPNQEAFLDTMQRVRLTRLRTGATTWHVYRHGELPDRFVEVYTVTSWDEHLRQHRGRLTSTDEALERAATALAEGPPIPTHLFPARRRF
jgi:MFS family permease